MKNKHDMSVLDIIFIIVIAGAVYGIAYLGVLLFSFSFQASFNLIIALAVGIAIIRVCKIEVKIEKL